MQVLIFGVLILVGFVCGYFFQTTVLIFLSILFLGIGILWMRKAQEVESAIAMVYLVLIVIADVAKWVTWYMVHDQTFVQEFLANHVLR
ncbi:MAG: hypothetical protein ACD_5C00293G0004 [uncultured bacterium]|nr:MAG: hypothetical protein ACD_5C00293G0004 [uncultured bacterium]